MAGLQGEWNDVTVRGNTVAYGAHQCVQRSQCEKPPADTRNHAFHRYLLVQVWERQAPDILPTEFRAWQLQSTILVTTSGIEEICTLDLAGSQPAIEAATGACWFGAITSTAQG
jgi:hypothetical protein